MNFLKSLLCLVVFMFIVLFSFSQYSVSNTTITFYDADRDRNIECGVYYPSVLDSNPGSVQFPYIIFGHGFSMGIGPYSYFGDGIVPEGVIVVMPSTETGLSPSHEAFAKDLAFLGNHFFDQSLEASGHFYNSVTDDYFIMGHSMGGGSSHLASSYDVNPRAIISFAAADTDPSAVDAAAEFDGKVVMFYGINDNVTPFDEHQEPIFNNSASTCKTLIGIVGGIHCYFNNYNFNCWFGEVAVGSNAEITREEQQQVVLDFVSLLVQSELHGDSDSHTAYLDSLDNSSRVSVIRECDQSIPAISVVDVNNDVQDITVAFDTPINDAIAILAQQIIVSDTDGGQHNVNLNWTSPTYNQSTAGDYQAIGTFSLPAGVVQSDPPTDLSVNATITVDDPVQTKILSIENINIFPNPVSDKLSIKSNQIIKTIELYDITGKIVISLYPNLFDMEIDLSVIEDGTYIVKVYTELDFYFDRIIKTN